MTRMRELTRQRGVAQLVARLLWEQEVTGAGPVTPTVIVVVEGPSGAGKTTWCIRHGGPNALLESLPDPLIVPTETDAAARFWVERNVARWAEVLEHEKRDGLVIVDTDPLKLHYVWSKWRTGSATEREWTAQRDAARHAFASGRYALADLVLVSDIPMEELHRRREADTTRMRRNFAIHVRLRDSLLAWYRAIDALDPGRVAFGLPDGGVPAAMLARGPRTERSGAALFDRMLSLLPAHFSAG